MINWNIIFGFVQRWICGQQKPEDGGAGGQTLQFENCSLSDLIGFLDFRLKEIISGQLTSRKVLLVKTADFIAGLERLTEMGLTVKKDKSNKNNISIYLFMERSLKAVCQYGLENESDQAVQELVELLAPEVFSAYGKVFPTFACRTLLRCLASNKFELAANQTQKFRNILIESLAQSFREGDARLLAELVTDVHDAMVDARYQYVQMGMARVWLDFAIMHWVKKQDIDRTFCLDLMLGQDEELAVYRCSFKLFTKILDVLHRVENVELTLPACMQLQKYCEKMPPQFVPLAAYALRCVVMACHEGGRASLGAKNNGKPFRTLPEMSESQLGNTWVKLVREWRDRDPKAAHLEVLQTLTSMPKDRIMQHMADDLVVSWSLIAPRSGIVAKPLWFPDSSL